MAERTATCIGIDWGTSLFRTWLFDPNGGILDSVQGPWGISQVSKTAFAQTLTTTIGHWLSAHGNLPIVMCGMIGSAQGWHEVQYLTGKVGIKELTAGTIKIPQTDVDAYIIPGIRAVSADGHDDVMRGEETLLASELDNMDAGIALFCLPGTHSKWIKSKNHTIESLTTFMTGEFFALLRQNSILSPLIEEGSEVDYESETFTEGLRLAQSPCGLLHHLFAIRAGVLTGRFARCDVLSLLSAVLIGNECVAIKTAHQASGELPSVGLMVSGSLAAAYQKAFRFHDIVFRSIDAERAGQAGLFAIFRQITNA